MYDDDYIDDEKGQFEYGFNNHEEIEESLGLDPVSTPVTLVPITVPTVTHIHWEEVNG
ncbi:MAG: hypothetical protein NT096_00175 [Proteobacteria bacterium]|nr:hypothetical protein [Pseudomonadota bacterium]